MYYVGLTLREHLWSTYTLTLKLHAPLYVCHYTGGDAGELQDVDILIISMIHNGICIVLPYTIGCA